MLLREVEYAKPTSVGEALELLAANDGARALAGGQTLVNVMKSRAAAPDMLTSCSAAEVADFVFRLRDGQLEGWTAPGFALQVPPSYEGIPIVTAESVAAAHRHGLEVHVWTIDDPAEIDALLDLGVDGIMTNLPALGLDVFRRRGLR